jgi:hypothetical protein
MHRLWMSTSLLACLAHAQSQPQTEGWLRAFVDRVPADACAVAAVEMPAKELGKMVLAALRPTWGEAAGRALAKAKSYQDLADLVTKTTTPLADRCGVVVRRLHLDPDQGIVDAVPVPEVACAFWLRPGADPAPLQQLLQTATSTQFVGLARQMFVMDMTGGAKVMEFHSPKIPGAGTVAIALSSAGFVISNSSGLAKQLIADPTPGRVGFGKAMSRLALEDPGSGRGTVLWRPEQVEAVLADWVGYIEKHTAATPTVAGTAAEAAVLQQLRNLLQLFPFAEAQLQFEQKTVPLVLARLLGG